MEDDSSSSSPPQKEGVLQTAEDFTSIHIQDDARKDHDVEVDKVDDENSLDLHLDISLPEITHSPSK